MKRLLASLAIAVVAVILFVSPMAAHPQQTQVWYFATTPTGACSNGPGIFVLSTGHTWTCQSGTWTDTTGGGGGGGGTVTSVGLTVPSWLTNSTPTITTSGTFAVTPTTAQTSHQVIGTCGSATTFAPCSLVAGDLPAGTGTVISVTFTGDGTVLSSTPSSAVTASGTLTAALANAAQNSVLAGPPTGGAGAPTYQTAPTFSGANLTNLPTTVGSGTASSNYTASGDGNGDTICAMAADTTNGQTTITSNTSSGSANVVNFSTANTQWFQNVVVGMIPGTSGNSSCTGGPFVATYVTSTQYSLSQTSNPGNCTNAITYLWCHNQTTDQVVGNPVVPFVASYTVPGNSIIAGWTAHFVAQEIMTTSTVASAPIFTEWLYNSNDINRINAAITPSVGLNAPGDGIVNFDMSATSTSWIDSNQFGRLNTTIMNTSNSVPPFLQTTSGNANVQFGVNWTPTAVKSITVSSITGCTISGTSGQTVLLTSFNNGSTATATVTLNATITASGFSGASNVGSIAITSQGVSATAAPTTATCSAGTVASATGTATFTSTLGGAARNSVTLKALKHP